MIILNTLSSLPESFSAFNQNALSSLLYIMQQNIWFVLIALSAVASTVMLLKQEMNYSTSEEQNII